MMAWRPACQSSSRPPRHHRGLRHRRETKFSPLEAFRTTRAMHRCRYTIRPTHLWTCSLPKVGGRLTFQAPRGAINASPWAVSSHRSSLTKASLAQGWRRPVAGHRNSHPPKYTIDQLTVGVEPSQKKLPEYPLSWLAQVLIILTPVSQPRKSRR